MTLPDKYRSVFFRIDGKRGLPVKAKKVGEKYVVIFEYKNETNETIEFDEVRIYDSLTNELLSTKDVGYIAMGVTDNITITWNLTLT